MRSRSLGLLAAIGLGAVLSSVPLAAGEPGAGRGAGHGAGHGDDHADHGAHQEAAEDGGDEGDDAPPRIFLDKSPRIVVYQLSRLSNRQLVRVERSPDDPKYRPVYEALLARVGLDLERRIEAVEALAAINRSDAVEQILAAIERLAASKEDPGSVLHDLAGLLARRGRGELLEKRGRLEALAAGAERPQSRQIGYAGLILCGLPAEEVWGMAAASANGPADLARSLAMVEAADARRAFYPRLRSLIEDGGGDDAAREAAIDAIVQVPGREAEAFGLLAALVRRGDDRAAAVRALRRIPAAARPAGDLDALAAALIEFIRETPESERTGPPALDAMQLGYELAAALPRERGAGIRKALGALGVRVILLRTVPHQMLYDARYFAVEAGKPAEIVLENPDIMPHNLVIVAPGALEEIGIAAEAMPPSTDPEAKQYVPESEKVLHATRLLQTGERETLRFTAPAEPGDYPFVCTFPGHWRRMYGVMVVVEDLEKWLENPIEPADPLGSTRRFVKEWKPEDFAADLGQPWGADAFEAGRKLFAEANCGQCHRVREQGGTVGPDLTEVFQRLKGKREDLLREILEPSKVVEEKYRVQIIRTRDGRTHAGLVVGESEESISIVTDPNNPVPREVRRRSILLRAGSDSSLMPTGLLNNYTRDEILALLAYLAAGGDPASPVLEP